MSNADPNEDGAENGGTRATLVAALAWLRDMGADEVVAAEPTDWLAKGVAPPPRADALLRERTPEQPPGTGPPAPEMPSAAAPRGRTDAPETGATPDAHRPPAGQPPAVTVSDEVAEANARAEARKAGSLDELHELLKSFDGCGLKKTAKNLCFYRGAVSGRVLVIGEAPGRDEDLAGKPFVGRAGQLLDKMLDAIGLSEIDSHITNVVYWRPPGNRVPTPQETLVCRPFLERQIRLVEPEIIVTLGGAAAKLILDTQQGIMKVRGKWREMSVPGDGDQPPLTIPVMPTLHPAYLLRSPAHKRHAWRDLLAIRKRLDGA